MANQGKTVFICQQCGSQYPKWMGRCSACQAWDTLVEENATKNRKKKKQAAARSPLPLSDVDLKQTPRLLTGLNEFDRVLGGGLVNGTIALVGGEPGIGKSTLLLQIAGLFSSKDFKTLYISGEESIQQIKLRAERLKINDSNILAFAETELDDIENQIINHKPDIVIIDSIQTIHDPDFSGAAGSVGQVRECAARFQQIAKTTDTPIFLVGHVTKEGAIAGPRILEHIVDTVLYFEGDSNHMYRMLRTVKNRYGASNEIAVFTMLDSGLREVENPSEMFLAGRKKGAPGTAALCVMRGTRPLLIEFQALVGKAAYGIPQRIASGIDSRRMSILIAVLEKSGKIPLGTHDVFANITGGIRVDEPGIDLGILCSIASSFYSTTIPHETVIIGEVGLSGEVRPVTKIEERLKEVSRMKFKNCLLPSKSIPTGNNWKDINLIGISTVRDAVSWLKSHSG